MLNNITKVTITINDTRPGRYGQGREVQRVQGQCACGRTIIIEYDEGDGWECACGRLYNLGGQELRPRTEWEEQMEDDY
jgi:hypothetical protein